MISRLLSTAITLIFMCIFPPIGWVQQVKDYSPVLYHLSFDNFDFLRDDAIEHSGFKTRDERKLSIVDGRFGGALHLGAKTELPDRHNMTLLDLDLVFQLCRIQNSGDNWCEPYIWGSDKIQPMQGSVAFWIKGMIEPETKLFFQSANAFGRFEKILIGVSLDRENHLVGYLVDASYDRHEIISQIKLTGDGWKHVVFTWESTSGLALYHNGEQVASSRGNDGWWMTQVPGLFYLPAGSFTYDELYIFDRPLIDTEVRNLYLHNNVPETITVNDMETRDVKSRLIEKSGVSTDMNLPVIRSNQGKATLVFEEIWTDKVTDGFIPGWWVMDGRYELAWPHPYSVFTVVLGDADYHARKADIQCPSDKTVNYITVEGNLEGIKVLMLEDDEAINTRTLLEVPKDHGFFYGSLVTPSTGKRLQIPFVKKWGTPYGYKGNVNLPLTGKTRLHEAGLFNVYEGNPRSGTTLYLSEHEVDPGKHYALAVKTFSIARDSEIVTAVGAKSSGQGRFVDTGVFKWLHILSEPMGKNTGVASVRLDLNVRTSTAEDVVLVRLRDPAVPSRIWTHAEVKIHDFNKKETGLFSLTLDMTDLALTEGERLWIDVCSVNGTDILVGNSQKPSMISVEYMPVRDAIIQYSPKEIVPALAEYSKMYESQPRHLNIQADYRNPIAYSGSFDMVYPTQAVIAVDPEFKIANYLFDFVGGKYNSAGELEDKSKLELKEFIGPENAPKWAIYQRAYNTPRHKVGDFYVARQNPDGQVGGGWNDDTMFLANDPFDVSVDSHDDVKKLLNTIVFQFEKTGMDRDGFPQLYPVDRHHARDFARLFHRIVIMNLGSPYFFEKALEIGWHCERPDRTPINYAQNLPFKSSYNIAHWYWGDDVPREPFINDNEQKVTTDMWKWASHISDESVFWYLTEAWTHTDNRDIWGSRDFYAVLLGGKWENVNDPHMEIAVTWPEGGGPDVSRWVEYADDTSLKVRMYSFDSDERIVTARLLRIKKGSYSVVLAPDKDNDGNPDMNNRGEVKVLRRFDDLDLHVPPGLPVLLKINHIESLEEPGRLPDLALGSQDIRISRKLVAVTVHNIGCVPAHNVDITLFVDGKPVETKTVESIDAPVDFVPRRYTLYFDHATGGKKVEAAIDPRNSIEEILERNNRAVASDYRSTGYFNW